MSENKSKRQIPQVTRELYEAMWEDQWPSPEAVADFGIRTDLHYGALQWAVKNDRVSIEKLDEARGSGERLQALVSETNPYRYVTFQFRETDQEREERMQHLIESGAPIPSGRELPAMAYSPAQSKEDALRRAAGEIASLKDSTFTTWKTHPLALNWDADSRSGGLTSFAVPDRSVKWGDITERGKYETMVHWVNWDGIALKDRAAMLTEQLDIEKLEPEIAARLRKAAGHPEVPAGGKRGPESERATERPNATPDEHAEHDHKSLSAEVKGGESDGRRRPEESMHTPYNLGYLNPKLMPSDLAETIPPLYSQENKRDPIAHAKYFTPDSSWTFYVVEYDPEERRAWGLVYGQEAELGPFSIDELESVRGPMGLPIERDEHFSPRPLSQCEDPCRFHENPVKPTVKRSR